MMTEKKSTKSTAAENKKSVQKYVGKPSKNLDEAIKKHANTKIELRPTETKKPKPMTMKRKVWGVVGWIAWMVASFFLAQVIVSVPLAFMQYSGAIDVVNMSTFETMLIQAAIYAVMLIVAVGGPWLLRRKLQLPSVKELLGLGRKPQWRDAGYAIVTTPVYYGILFAVTIVVTLLLTMFIGTGSTQELMGQAQEISFSTAGNSALQLVIIFVALVVIPPVVEEVLMRGLLFGRLRKSLSFWVTAVLVSLTFAVAHWQVNVGIDTFVLSMVMCYVREKTGSVWATILMHMIKNGIAFALLFVVHIPGLS